MINIGFNFATSDFRYAVLDGTFDDPNLLEKNKILYPEGMDIVAMTGWFETQIDLILDKYETSNVSYKIPLTLKATKHIQNSIFPLGILNLSCQKKNIPINFYTSQGINGSKFGLPKKTNVYNYTNEILGTHPPYWDNSTKNAVLIAWYNLPK